AGLSISGVRTARPSSRTAASCTSAKAGRPGWAASSGMRRLQEIDPRHNPAIREGEHSRTRRGAAAFVGVAMSLTHYEDAPAQSPAQSPAPAPSLPPVKPEARIGSRAIRAYDIRGVVGADFDAAGARALGLSYAAYARARGLRRIVVGRDGRLSSPALERALVNGLAAGGGGGVGLGRAPRARLALRG